MPEISEFDQEFTTEGNAGVETEKLEALIQKNLTPEEQNFMEQAKPVVAQFMGLLQKATGQNPEDLEETASINPQGVSMESMRGTGAHQQGQTQPMVPPRAVQGQAPQNAPETPQEMPQMPQMPQMALGDKVPPVIQENVEPMGNPGDVAAGPVGLVNDPGADESGVADDVPAKSDGFVINAAAVKHAGLKDINDMIQNAKEYAEQKGIKLNFGKTPTGAEDILVSNGEVVIPDKLANIIGYDRLEKINNRGKKETEEKLAAQEEGAPPEGPPANAPATPPVLQYQMTGLT